MSRPFQADFYTDEGVPPRPINTILGSVDNQILFTYQEKVLDLFGLSQKYTYCLEAIPDICHGRHGHVRVNFFWPV